MVSALSETRVPLLTCITCTAPPPLTVMLCPVPSMLTSSLMAGKVAKSVIVPLTLNVMLSAPPCALAVLIASRRVQSATPQMPSSWSAARVTMKLGPLCAGSSASYAPLSQCTPCVRSRPRWSRLLTGAGAHTASSPASMAALPDRSAIVHVGPPLLAREPRVGSPKVPTQLLSVLGQRRLCPPSVMTPKQLPPLLLATMVFLRVGVPVLTKMPPPALPALLPLKVLLLTVSVPPLAMPPPYFAKLPLSVTFVSVAVPSL